MSKNNSINNIKAQIAARLANARIEAEDRKAETAQLAAAQRDQARKEANRRINNTTFRNIYYIFNNIIHEVQPDESVRPIIGGSYEYMDPDAAKKFKAEIEAYNLLKKNYKPTKTIKKKISVSFGKSMTVKVEVPNEPLPPPPTPPPSARKLNAAVSDIVTDPVGARIYWARWASPFQVASMKMDGSDIKVLYNLDEPATSVAIDAPNNMLYWLQGNRKIMKGKMDGSGNAEKVLDIMAPDKGGLWQLELDLIRRNFYWTNDISIWRAEMDNNDVASTSLMVISPSESPFPIDLVIDGINGYLYWIDKDMKMVRRSDLEGITIENLYDIHLPTKGIKVDPVANFLYWSDKIDGSHQLLRAPTRDTAIMLDGKSQYVDIFPITPPDSFSVEMWVNPRSKTANQAFLAKNTTNGGNVFILGQYKSKLSMTIMDKSVDFGDARKGLFHLAGTYKKSGNKTQVKLYVDGKKVYDGELAATFDFFVSYPWTIGMEYDSTGPSDFMLGSFQELAFWSGIRTDSEIASQMHVDYTGQEKNLLAYWRSDHMQNIILPDLGPNRYLAKLLKTSQNDPFLQSVISLKKNGDGLKLPTLNIKAEQGLTIEAWFKLSSSTNNGRIVELGNGSKKDNIILAFDGTTQGLVFSVYDQAKSYTLKIPAKNTIRPWVHVAVSMDSTGTAQAYINGNPTGAAKTLYPPADIPRTQNFVAISTFDKTNSLVGQIAEVRIWEKAKKQDEIVRGMYRRAEAGDEGLFACWPMNEGSGSIAYNVTDHALNGTYVTDINDLVQQRNTEQKNQTELNQTLKREQDALTVIQNDKSRIDQLSAASTAAAKTLQNAEKALSTATGKVQAQQANWDKAKSSLQQKQGDLAKWKQMQQDAVNINQTIDTSQKDLNNLQSQQPALKAKLDKATTRKNQHDSLMAQMVSLQQKVQQLSAQISAEQAKLTGMNAQLQVLKAQEKSFPSIFGAKNPFTSQVKSQQAKVNAQKAKINSLKAQVNDSNNQINSLQNQLNPLKSAVSDWQVVNGNFQNLSNQIKNVQSDIATAQKNLNSIQKSALFKKKENDLNTAISKAQDALDKEAVKLAPLTDTMNKASLDKDNAQRLADQAKQKYDTNKAQYDQDLKAKQDHIKSLNTSIKNSQTTIDKLTKEISGDISRIWSMDSFPILSVLKPVYEVEEVVKVPGLDGMSLVHADVYARARRKDAYDTLKRAESKANADIKRAQDQKLDKIANARTEKEVKRQEAQKIESDAKSKAQTSKDKANKNKRNAESNAVQKIENAKDTKHEKVKTANTQAAGIKQNAENTGNQLKKNAETRRDNAKADYKKAQKERAKH